MLESGQKSAMISSTAIDLPDHRKEVFEGCLCEGVFPVGMESLPARDAGAIHASLEMVNRADIYIGIFAWRYGHIPKGHRISITEMEFNRAVERGIPILIFLIHKEHPITRDMVQTDNGAETKLKRLKKLACKGRLRCEFKSPIELRAQVIQALSDLKQRELQARSPIHAIRSETKRLLELDSNSSVYIAADSQSIRYEITLPETGMDFLNKFGEETLKGVFEKGQPIQVRAKDIPTDISPILNDLLGKVGDATITIKAGIELNGCLQFVLRSSRNEPILMQADGKWLLAQKRGEFKGSLGDSPLSVQYAREIEGEVAASQVTLEFNFNFNSWKGQPLLGLAYFSELEEFAKCNEFSVRSFIRGNQVWTKEDITLTDKERRQVVEALEWLRKARRAAQYLGLNPPFPEAETINANVVESRNVHLMMRLIEVGTHEQVNSGKILGLACDRVEPTPEIGKKELTISHPEHFMNINFFGVEIPFGPLIYTWTDLELIEMRPLKNNRVEMTFKGGPKSTWRIDYKKRGKTPAGGERPS